MKKLLIILVLLIIILHLFSIKIQATQKKDYVLGKNMKLYSKILNEERDLSIYLPPGYEKMDLKYPILFTLDGYFLWPTGIVDYLSFSGNIPQMIVVSIKNTDRERDFTPTKSKNIEGEFVPTSGGAKKFLQFLEKELIPYIDKNYRTEPYRLIAGHSMGGLFVTYALLENPTIFQAYIAVSATLPWDNEILKREANKKLKSKYPRNLFFSLSMDSQKTHMYEASKNFIKQLEIKKPENLKWKFTRYEKEDHISCFLIAFYESLRELYSTYKIPGKLIESGDAKKIEAHYSNLTQQYNYIIIPSWAWIDWIANWHQLMKRFSEAISLYELAVKYYPESSRVHFRLGLAYEAAGKYQKSILSYLNARIYSANEKETKRINEKIKKLKLMLSKK